MAIAIVKSNEEKNTLLSAWMIGLPGAQEVVSQYIHYITSQVVRNHNVFKHNTVMYF